MNVKRITGLGGKGSIEITKSCSVDSANSGGDGGSDTGRHELGEESPREASPREASDTISSLLSVEASAERLSARTSRVGLLTGYSGSASSGFLQLSSAPAGKEAPRPTLESLYPTTPTEHSSGPRTWPGDGAAAAQRAGGLQRAAQSVDASSDNTERFVRTGAPTRRLHRRDSLKLDGLITDPHGPQASNASVVWIGNVPASLPEQTIRSAFAIFGAVGRVFVRRKPGAQASWALLTFRSAHAAVRPHTFPAATRRVFSSSSSCSSSRGA